MKGTAPDPLKTKLVAEKGNHVLRTKQRHACRLKAVQRRAFRVTTGEFLKNYLYIMQGSIKPLPCKPLVCSGRIPFQPSCSSVGEFMQAHTSLLFVFLLSKIWSRGHAWLQRCLANLRLGVVYLISCWRKGLTEEIVWLGAEAEF